MENSAAYTNSDNMRRDDVEMKMKLSVGAEGTSGEG